MAAKKRDDKDSSDELKTRELTRTPMNVPVRVHGPKKGKKKTVTADLSEAGTFVTGSQAEVGTEVSLEIDLPDGEKVEVEGEVRWVRPDTINPNLPAGMGVKFKEPQPRIAEAIRSIDEESET